LSRKFAFSSAAMERSRKPYRMRNYITLFGLSAFVVAVYSYSILAVKQDDFSDADEE